MDVHFLLKSIDSPKISQFSKHINPSNCPLGFLHLKLLQYSEQNKIYCFSFGTKHLLFLISITIFKKKKMARQFVVFALLALAVATAFAADAPSAAPTVSPTKAPTTPTKAPAAAPKSSAAAPKASSPVAEEPTPEDDYSAATPSDSAEAPTVSSPPAPTPEADGPSTDGPSSDGPTAAESPKSGATTNVKLSIAGTVAAAGFFIFSL
ncbi:hypothetical protein ISN44_As08g000420 [Arabidopsis suecica]|uniref:Uncharacterized protein n=1 Tax=Arabidopsis suecica TaxID=45249 RepID=A0A8T2B0V1_ARASU|nr:hypothetical protein ISN44_As08g000420 [Arabidopsis suecica]